MAPYKYDSEPDYRQQAYDRMIIMMRFMMSTFLLAMVMLFIIQVGRIMPSVERMISARADVAAAQAAGLKAIPDLEARIADLDKRTKALTSEEVESRLTRIETAIRLGRVNTQDLASLQELRRDFDNLKTFMFARPEQLVDFRTMQRDYLELKENAKNSMSRQEISREIDSTKTMFWWNLAVFGILTSIFVGTWFVGFRQTMKLREQAPQSPPQAQTKAD
jgi:hypothetical protein